MKQLFGLAMFFLMSLQVKSQVQNITALEIVNRSIDAMGGIEYLRSIKTLYSDTKTTMEGRLVHWIIKEMLPNKGSFQIVYNDRVVYSDWFDGKKGYSITNGKKKKTDKDYFKDKLYKKNIINELDYIDSTLWKLEYLGVVTLGIDSCYKIKGTLVNGLVEVMYFDKSSFHMVRNDKISNAEKDRYTTYLFSNFKKFDKLVFYTEMKMGENGSYQLGTIEKLLINQEVEESDFN